MPQMRYNLITGEWVILATERGQRPHDFAEPERPTAPAAHDPDCPFCPGNEDQTGPPSLTVPAQGAWRLRVVPNRYPALSPEGQPVRTGAGYEMAINGVGCHEVVIESPAHDAQPARMGAVTLTEVVRAWQARMDALYRLPHVEHVIVFKNHGEQAGCSLIHPHSQIVGVPVLPGQVRQRLEAGMKFHGDQGECVYCHCLRKELSQDLRIVEQDAHHVAFLPFAALSPFHTWIFPRRHKASFLDADASELGSLAAILGSVLSRLDQALGDPAYNLVLRSLGPAERGWKAFHWYLSIVPRVSKTAGFELGTGMFVNPLAPEDGAARLRVVAP